LREGYEANFLVLNGNPLVDFYQVKTSNYGSSKVFSSTLAKRNRNPQHNKPLDTSGKQRLCKTVRVVSSSCEIREARAGA
jgi:hypothetical protein